ncbi:MAG: PaaI family thioesterase [Halobacteriales archaeon]
MPESIDQAFYRTLLEDDPFLAGLGCRLEAVESGRLELSVPFDDDIALHDATPGLGGVLHAGVIATLVDCGGEVVRTTFDDPRAVQLATTDLNVEFLRPATDDVRVRATCERAGSAVGVSDVRVESRTETGEPTTVAVGRGTYHLSTLDSDSG